MVKSLFFSEKILRPYFKIISKVFSSSESVLQLHVNTFSFIEAFRLNRSIMFNAGLKAVFLDSTVSGAKNRGKYIFANKKSEYFPLMFLKQMQRHLETFLLSKHVLCRFI